MTPLTPNGLLDVVVNRAEKTQEYILAIQDRQRKENAQRIQKATFITQTEVKKHSSGGTIGGARSREKMGGIGKATGKLAQAWSTSFQLVGQDTIGKVVNPLVYARIQDVGGTVTAKDGGYLTVPIHAKAIGKRAGDFGDALRLVVTGRGLFLVLDYPGTKTGRGARSEFLFILKKSVTIPASHYIDNAIRDARPQVLPLLEAGTDIAIEKGKSDV